MTKLKKIYVCALGGTIAMAPDLESNSGSGVKPVLGGRDLVAGVSELSTIADVTAESLISLGSANLNFSIAHAVIERAYALAENGADGIVVTQGTDTMEEMAFLLSLVWQGSIPIVMTGAMKHPALEGADGPANLLAAVQTAIAAPKGVYVVMDGTVHDPATVRKSHTSALSAFVTDGGALGSVSQGVVRLDKTLAKRPTFDIATLAAGKRVAVITPQFDDDGWQITAITAEKFDGAVIAAFGGGHVSEAWSDKLHALAREMPVVLTSRIGAGRVLTNTYGYKGAEIDLIGAGLVPAGGLTPHKARLLLMLALSQSDQKIGDAFASF